MHFSLELLIPALRLTPQMRQQQRTFAFGGDDLVCDPEWYAWGQDVQLRGGGALPAHLLRHVPATHRSKDVEIVCVRGGLYELRDPDPSPSELETLLRFQLRSDEPWAVVFSHDDDGVAFTRDGVVDDVIDALRTAVMAPPERGFVFVHTPPTAGSPFR